MNKNSPPSELLSFLYYLRDYINKMDEKNIDASIMVDNILGQILPKIQEQEMKLEEEKANEQQFTAF